MNQATLGRGPGGSRPTIRACLECGEDYVRKSNRAKRCPSCQARRKARLCRENARCRRAANPDHVRAVAKAWRETPNGKRRAIAYTKTWRAKNPGAQQAHEAVNTAVRRGKMIRPEKCQRCGAGGRIEAHHEDYSRKLDVEWLCRSCHRGTFRQPGREERP